MRTSINSRISSSEIVDITGAEDKIVETSMSRRSSALAPRQKTLDIHGTAVVDAAVVGEDVASESGEGVV